MVSAELLYTAEHNIYIYLPSSLKSKLYELCDCTGSRLMSSEIKGPILSQVHYMFYVLYVTCLQSLSDLQRNEKTGEESSNRYEASSPLAGIRPSPPTSKTRERRVKVGARRVYIPYL